MNCVVHKFTQEFHEDLKLEDRSQLNFTKLQTVFLLSYEKYKSFRKPRYSFQWIKDNPLHEIIK